MSAPVLLGEQPRPAAPDRFDARKLRDYFECLVEANGGVDHFRGLIINLAIRGRLGTQDPNDAPADALLQLAKRVLGGDQKRRSLDGRLEPEYRLPEGWCWCEPQDLGRIAPRNDVPDDLPVGFVPMTNVPTDYRRPVTYESRPWKEIKKGYTHIADGDIAVAKITPCFQNGKSCVVKGLPNGLGAGTTELLVLRPVLGVVHPNYLLLFFKSPDFLSHGVGLMTGTAGQQRVPVEYFASVPLPLPPLAEQKRIVAQVDQLMALCDDLEARQTKKREIGTRLTKSALEALTAAESPAEFDAAWKRVEDNFDVLIDRAEKVSLLRSAIVELAVRGHLAEQRHDDGEADALLDRIEAERAAATASGGRVPTPLPIEQAAGPYPIPARWRWVRWGHLALGSDSGWSPQCEARPRDGDEWGVVKVSAVSWNAFKPEENKALPGGEDARPACAIHAGDFLMSRANTADLVGRSVIVDAEPVHLMMSDKIVRCTFAGPVNKRYVNLFNQTASARAHYIANASGTSDSMKNISRDVVFSMPVALPPLAEQDRIVARVQQLVQICDDLEAKLLRAEDRAARLVEAAVQELVAS